MNSLTYQMVNTSEENVYCTIIVRSFTTIILLLHCSRVNNAFVISVVSTAAPAVFNQEKIYYPPGTNVVPFSTRCELPSGVAMITDTMYE